MFATFAVDSCLNGQAADYPYRDHFHTSCPGQPPDAQALLQAFIGAPPAWAQALMRARNRLMAPLGLKTADLPRQAPQARVGEAVGVFCVWHAGPDELLLGQRDRWVRVVGERSQIGVTGGQEDRVAIGEGCPQA